MYYFLLRLVNKKSWLKRQLATGTHNLYHCPEPPASISQTCHVHKVQINSRNVFTLEPKNSKKVRHILYLHGGAYIQGFTKPHWNFLAELAVVSGCTIIAPDYPLAPKYTYRESFAMVIKVYRQMIMKAHPHNITVMGDSAGGGFALALVQKIKEEDIPQPENIILLSPWLDITLSNPDIKDIDAEDPFLGIEGLRQAGRLYAGDLNPGDYLVSPINGSLKGLGKISVFVGSKELLVADARKLRDLAVFEGIDINYYEYADMVHAWMLLNFPESKKAKQQIIDLLS